MPAHSNNPLADEPPENSEQRPFWRAGRGPKAKVLTPWEVDQHLGIMIAALNGSALRALADENRLPYDSMLARVKVLLADVLVAFPVDGFTFNKRAFSPSGKRAAAVRGAIEQYRNALAAHARPVPAQREPTDLRRELLEATAGSRTALRDAAIVMSLFGTGATASELSRLQVKHFLEPSGTVRRSSEISEQIASNGVARPLFWMDPEVVAAVENYLSERRPVLDADHARYRGIRPDAPLFVDSKSGNAALQVSVLLRKLAAKANLTTGAIGDCARKDFCAKLARRGVSAEDIAELLYGHRDKKQVRKHLLEAGVHLSSRQRLVALVEQATGVAGSGEQLP